MIKNKFFILLASAALLISGCKKELDISPTDTIDPDRALQNLDAIRLGLNTAYARYGRINTMYISSLLSDETKFGPDNGGSGQFDFRYQYGSDGTTGGNVISAFGNLYSMLDMVARLMEKVDEVPGEEAQRPIMKAELLSLRAIGHFELLNWYSKPYNAADPLGVPILLQSCLTCKPARNTVGEVMTQIEADIAEAKALFPNVTAGFDDLRLNKLSLTAFEARVALYKSEWQRAVDLATTVISSGIEPLVSGAAYQGIWTDANTNETLFRLRYENNAAVGNLWTAVSGNVIFSPSDKLTASYSANDVRLNAFIGVGPTGGIGAGKRFVNKFFNSSRGGRIVDVKAIRTAEVYLIRAEAYAELNNLVAGAADLNFLRERRITGYVNQTFGDKAALINAVLDERFKELAFEGFRFFDLKRRNLPVQRLASDVDSPNWQTLSAGNDRFTLPIPASEFLANPNMVQNPGPY
ncbi:MAG TPA: RagB/SusD family nutrient uptake outer membrane protein [Flavisolibacter sp.]|nr:RagB/SusD family nutrient uptake outer membrane protein [Flavisolibacter sp.]